MTQVSEPRHPDFQKIYSQFQARYCTGDSEETSPKGGPCPKGDQVYYAWLNKLGLDDTKPYGEQVKTKEGFTWAEPTIEFLKEQGGKRLYKIELLFPLTSMNDNIYTEDELIKSARMLKGVTPNLNHWPDAPCEGAITEDAEYENGAIEAILSVDPEAPCPGCEQEKHRLVDMLDHKPEVPQDFHIFHASIEAKCRTAEPSPDGNLCKGLLLDGYALLTKNVLPGIPLTKIEPIEALKQNKPLGNPSETTPTKPDLLTRVKQLKAQGMSARDSWRLACFELLDWISTREATSTSP